MFTTQEQCQAIVDEIEKQTDRGAAIIAAATIDDVLQDLITARLIELSSKRKKALFESNGPLSSLSAKIEMAFALGLFNRERRESLDLIRDVRNRFAHMMNPVSFDHPDISAIVEARITPEVRVFKASPRMKFLFTANTLMIYLGFAASFPHLRVNMIDDDPAYRRHFDAIFAAMLSPLIERLSKPSDRRPTSEEMKRSLPGFPELTRQAMEDHLRRTSGPLRPDTADAKRIYSDGTFELCKNQSGEYVLIPIPSGPDHIC